MIDVISEILVRKGGISPNIDIPIVSHRYRVMQDRLGLRYHSVPKLNQSFGIRVPNKRKTLTIDTSRI